MTSKYKGLRHYPLIETEHYMSGNIDLYYGHVSYNKHRLRWLQTGCEASMTRMESFFDRQQYIIYKKHDNPEEIIILKDGLKLDWDAEIEKGLDHFVVSHKWQDPKSLDNAYRFANGKALHPIGEVHYLAPDLFYWNKQIKEFNS